MSNLKFRFNHPVEGKASFRHPDTNEQIKTVEIKSNDSHEIEISLDGVSPGRWHILVEWEHNKELFSLKRDIVVEQ